MNTKEIKYLLLLMSIFIAACIETDIYLPAFPDMMNYFSATESAIQNILTWNFIGLCLSGLLYGPLSDSFGRKKPLICALALFLIGSLLTVIAQNFTWMLWGRVLQGLGSGGCFTLGTAIIFDVFKEQKAVHALNKMNSLVPFLLASAPLIGGYLTNVYGFRSNFLLIAFAVLASFTISLLFFDETLPKEKRSPLNLAKLVKDFKRIATYIPFWQLTAIISLLFSGLICFLSGISILFVVEFHISKASFPLYQAAVLSAYLAASLTCSLCIRKWGIPLIKKIGMLLTAAGALGLLITSIAMPKNPLLLTASMLPYSFGFIWTQTPYVGEVMGMLPDIKGIAASLLTSTRLLAAAIIIALTSYFYNSTIIPIAIAISLISLTIVYLSIRYEKRAQHSTPKTRLIPPCTH